MTAESIRSGFPWDRVKTEPMPVGAFASWCDCDIRTAKAWLGTIEGVQAIGRLYRIPVSAMPPKYLAEAGFTALTDISAHSEA